MSDILIFSEYWQIAGKPDEYKIAFREWLLDNDHLSGHFRSRWDALWEEFMEFVTNG